jgi:hypothetical protein
MKIIRGLNWKIKKTKKWINFFFWKNEDQNPIKKQLKLNVERQNWKKMIKEKDKI